MIADLHAHYPMHLDPGVRGNILKLLRTRRGQLRIRDHLRAVGVNFASQFANYPSLFSGPRVRIPWMAEGGVGVALSVLYSFFDEADTQASRGSDYVDEILRQARLVEQRVARDHAHQAAIAHNVAELDAARAAGKIALVHCVEGGFHLRGESPADIARAVEMLARAGVAYITLAHLIWRGVATSANALPFLSDKEFGRRCRQPPIGLSSLGRAAVDAMLEQHVLIDVSHMSEHALADTFALLDDRDPEREVPVIASHGACRFGDGQEYNLSEPTVKQIADRGGVIGLIFAQHQLYDGLPKRRRKSFQDGFDALCTHIDRIAQITGSHRHVAIGSDFDGFIKPTLHGLRDMRDMRLLHEAVHLRYKADGDAICSGNALRVLRSYWRGSPASP